MLGLLVGSIKLVLCETKFCSRCGIHRMEAPAKHDECNGRSCKDN